MVEKNFLEMKDFLKTVELVKVKFFIIMMMIMNFHIYMLMFVLVYPSLYEGFGIPVLTMSSKCQLF